jgi:shikimate dehydrogenase
VTGPVPPPAVSGSTRLAAVIGDPVRHSLSPALHNAAFRAVRLDWVYLALPVPAGEAPAALAGMRALGSEGLSVTMPHKEAVAVAVDRLGDAAARLRAVNCVRREGDVLVGENTDGAGFVRSLREEAGVDPSGARAVVIGAGGAARAVIVALASAGADSVVVVNRDEGRARAAAALAGVASVGAAAAVADADLVVNATPVGMGGAPGLPLDPDLLGPRHLVADLVYHPPVTPLLAEAARRGARPLGGIGMLLYQAAIAWEMWTGLAAPVDAMRTAVAHLLDPAPAT